MAKSMLSHLRKAAVAQTVWWSADWQNSLTLLAVNIAALGCATDNAAAAVPVAT